MRISRVNGELVANSSSTSDGSKEGKDSGSVLVPQTASLGVAKAVASPDLDLLVACCERGVVMVEMGGREVGSCPTPFSLYYSSCLLSGLLLCLIMLL